MTGAQEVLTAGDVMHWRPVSLHTESQASNPLPTRASGAGRSCTATPARPAKERAASIRYRRRGRLRCGRCGGRGRNTILTAPLAAARLAGWGPPIPCCFCATGCRAAGRSAAGSGAAAVGGGLCPVRTERLEAARPPSRRAMAALLVAGSGWWHTTATERLAVGRGMEEGDCIPAATLPRRRWCCCQRGCGGHRLAAQRREGRVGPHCPSMQPAPQCTRRPPRHSKHSLRPVGPQKGPCPNFPRRRGVNGAPTRPWLDAHRENGS